ncbi:MAG TPA: serine hydrolase domain-containing protein [Methanothrix sp.]|nr:serine hydrolase domain-containing protein [Methanothrix sp.]
MWYDMKNATLTILIFLGLFTAGCIGPEDDTGMGPLEGVHEPGTELVEPELKEVGSASNAIDFSSLDKTILEELNETNTPGCAVAIVSGDEVVYARGFGLANVETGLAVTPKTLFLIGSTTKPFTAYTVLSMAEEGMLDINDPVGNYIKGLSPRLSNITAAQLLSHTAGLKDPYPFSETGKWDVESGLEDYVKVMNDTLFFSEPGEIFSYSNGGYSLAGYTAQTLGGKPYPETVEERVLKPLGMNSTTFYLEMAVTYPMSLGYIGDESGNVTVMRPFEEYVFMWPAGFLFSNVLDMAKFAEALMNNGSLDDKQVLSPQIINEMFTPHADLLSVYPDASYGYGTMMYNYRGMDVVEHGGNHESFTCVFKMVPEHKFALIILNNGDQRYMANTTKKAFELMLPLEPEVRPEPLEMNGSEMGMYVGNYSQYSQYPELVLGIIMRDGKLLSVDPDVLSVEPGGHEYPMEKLSDDQFIIIEPGSPEPEYVKFVRSDDGMIKYLHRGCRAFPKIAS